MYQVIVDVTGKYPFVQGIIENDDEEFGDGIRAQLRELLRDNDHDINPDTLLTPRDVTLLQLAVLQDAGKPILN